MSRGSFYYSPLFAAPSDRRRSGTDAPDRRTASRISIRGKSNVARACERRRAGNRAAPCRYADEEDGHRGDLLSPEHLQANARTQDLSLSSVQAGDCPAQSGMGDGPDLYPHGSRLRLTLRRRGLVQSQGFVAAIIDHDGGGLLYRSGRGSAGSLWKAGNIQHRSGTAIYLHRLHRRA